MVVLPHASPLAIGGVGGSGTRLIQELMQSAGYWMGDRLNSTLDDMRFSESLVTEEALTCSEIRFDELLRQYLDQLVDVHGLPALEALDVMPNWGWKEPNTHLHMHRIALRIPNIRYVHVLRNGLDMAFSANQQQVMRWGEHLLGHPIDGSPRHSLRYWVLVHRRIQANCMRLGNRFLMLNYDRLCTRPDEELPALLRFAGVDPKSDLLARLRPLIKPPESIGRFRQHGLHEFDAADVDYVRSLGFDVD